MDIKPANLRTQNHPLCSFGLAPFFNYIYHRKNINHKHQLQYRVNYQFFTPNYIVSS